MMGQQNPALVIMAAGIGSRYAGGIKQLEPVGPNGELIIDYSIYDAVQAGFRKIIFVIRHEIERDFREIREAPFPAVQRDKFPERCQRVSDTSAALRKTTEQRALPVKR